MESAKNYGIGRNECAGGVSSSNQPAFATSLRILIFRKEALGRRYPWSLREAAEHMEVHPRTIRRYLHLLAVVETDEWGEPLLKLEYIDGVPFIVKADFTSSR